MAGSYPDVPGYRFTMDIDGTMGLAFKRPTGPILTLTPSQMGFLNRDSTDNGGTYRVAYNNLVGGNDAYAVFIFPEYRDITGYFFYMNNTSVRTIEVSTNTTNGDDGTWTVVEPLFEYTSSESNPFSTPMHRTEVQSVSWMGVKAVRVTVRNYVYSMHFYGSIATTESPDRLRVVDMSGDDIAAQLDFGNLQQGSSSTKQFKVVNNSATQTASNITVSVDVTSDASPTLVGQYQVSTDNISFANAVNIGNLAPGAESATMYVRNNVASNAQLGPWSARIIASAVSWS